MFLMFGNPRRGRQARNFTTNVPKILDLKSSSEQIFFRKLSLGAPEPFITKHEKMKIEAIKNKETIKVTNNDNISVENFSSSE